MEPAPVPQPVCWDGHGPAARRVRLLRTCGGSPQVLQNFSLTAAVKLLLTCELVKVTRPVQVRVGRLKLRISEQTDANKPPWKQLGSSSAPARKLSNFPSSTRDENRQQTDTHPLHTSPFWWGPSGSWRGEEEGAREPQYINIFTIRIQHEDGRRIQRVLGSKVPPS